MKAKEPKLCPDCPLTSLLPIVVAERVSYTRQKEPLTPLKICQKLRALMPGVCPHFKNERIDAYAEAAEKR